MNSYRLTVLRDRPAGETPIKLANAPFRIWKSKATGIYFLDDVNESSDRPPVFAGFYDSFFDLSETTLPDAIEAFLNGCEKRFAEHQFHRDVVLEAIVLSEACQTRVMSYYGDDEDTDCAAIAENGKLLRLRFKGEKEVVRKLSEDEARSVESEISAVRVSPDHEGGIDVSEFVAFEALMTETDPLNWMPFWRFYEGEIGRNVIFRTVWQTPDSVAGNLMFRNARLEFAEAFGAEMPDPYYDAADFEFVADIRISSPRRRWAWANRLARGLVRLIKKYPISAGIIGLILIGAVIPRDDTPSRQKPGLKRDCEISGGVFRRDKAANSVTPGSGNRCILAGQSYASYELPIADGSNGDVAVILGAAPCATRPEEVCPTLDGKIYEGEIEGFNFEPEQRGVLVLERHPVCQPVSPGQCEDGTPPFEFSLKLHLGGTKAE